MKKSGRKSAFQKRLRKAEFTGVIMSCSGTCPFCGNHPIFLINLYDAKGCLSCNQWLENACSDPECPFCANRPETPSGAFFLLKDSIRRHEQLFRKDWRRKNYQHQHDGEMHHQKQKLLYQELKNKGG
ncbi:MAG: hypothetical protein IJJ69_01570 [Oscillospiraceae bacterium]|nr:hypothetical protein [Oscillospiraceae bacterium]